MRTFFLFAFGPIVVALILMNWIVGGLELVTGSIINRVMCDRGAP